LGAGTSERSAAPKAKPSRSTTTADEGFLWQNGNLRDLGLYFPQAINTRGQVLGIDKIWDNGTTVPPAASTTTGRPAG
jgi:hypothetical protein